LITIAGSSYLIEHNERIYQRFQRFFRPFEPRSVLQEERLRDRKPYQIVLFGWHRTGQELLKTIKKLKKSYVVVDFDPLAIRELAESGEEAVYGDAGDENFLEEVKVDRAKLVVSTIPDLVISISLLSFLKTREYKGVVVVSVHTEEEALKCYELGANYVIVPTVLSGQKFSEILKKRRVVKKEWA